VIIIDANLLIYAIDSDAPHHTLAKPWLEKTLSSEVIVGLPWIVILAFLRITTNARIMQKPLSSEAAIGYIDTWFSQPFVKSVSPDQNHWSILRNLLIHTGVAGNLTSDAHIAALAIEQGYTVYSADNDFKRFPYVSHVNPLS